VERFLSLLKENEIYVSVTGENLSVKFPKGSVNKQLLAELKEKKDEIISYLNKRKAAKVSAIPVIAEQPAYELSSAQSRLWLLCQFEGSSVAYNIPGAVVFEGALNRDALSEAFKAVIGRHEILRTVFRSDDAGTVYQYILPQSAIGFEIDHHDLRNAKDQEVVLREYIINDFRRVFNLAAGPLLSAALYQVADNKWVFSYVMHHIISDGWSMGVFFNELLRSYNNFVNAGSDALPTLRIQYKDYAAWQRTQNADHKTYWLQQFEGEIPTLELPLDKVRPAVKTYNGGLVKHSFNAELSQRINSLLREEDCTLFMGLLSAVNTLLYRYTGQQDIIIGSPVANRGHNELHDQIGLYVNTIALRSRFSGDSSFRSLLQSVKAVTLGAYAHQSYPFDALVTDLSLQHDPARSALFDVMVTMQNAGDDSVRTNLPEGLALSSFGNIGHATSRFDLLFNFHEANNAIHAAIEYNSDLLEKETVTRMMFHLEQLLNSIVAGADASLDTLNYLSDKEKDQLLVQFNDTSDESYPLDRTIIDLLEQQVQRTPDAVAVTFETQQLTYKELDAQTNKLAHYLIDRGVETETLVPICLERSIDMIIAIIGIMKAGGAYVPIDPEYPAERIDYMLSDTGASFAISNPSYAGKLNVSIIDIKDAKEQPDAKPQVVIAPGNLAYVIYTSGSTGKPKGAMNEHSGLVNRLWWAQHYFKLTAADAVLQKTTYCFDVSVWELLWPLIAGAKLVFAKPGGHKDSEYLRRTIEHEQITMLHFVPSMLSVFLNELEPDACATLKKVLCSGEALTASQVELFKQKLPAAELHNLYGPTEAAIDVTYYSIVAGAQNIKTVPIGKPVANTSIYILDASCNLVPVGIAGELYIGGVQVARGYLNRPDMTNERFISDPFVKGARMYRTGDRARWLADGNIEYLGRIDFQVKVRGYRIEPGEIETALERHDKVSNAVVLAKEAQTGKELTAYVVCDESVKLADLRLWLSELLPDYMIPAYFVRLHELPLTDNGKIDRKKLLAHKGGEMSGGQTYVAPVNEYEEKLVALFATELNLSPDKVGTHDNFFALGGDSMKGMRVIVKIKQVFITGITISDLYRHQTIAALAEWLQQNSSEDIQAHEMKAGLLEIASVKQQIENECVGTDKLPGSYEDIFPMTPIEQGMIYSSLLRPEAPVYYDQFAFFVQIENITRFHAGISKLMTRHTVLRTKYYMNSFYRPVKIVLNDVEPPVAYEDVSLLPEEDKIQHLRQFLNEDVKRRWTFDNELLWRLRVVKLEGDKYYVVISFHHSVLDGWSVSIFATELTNLLAEDSQQELPALKHSYKDYCAIVLGRKKSERVDAYWKNLLQDYSRNKLPFNYKGLKISGRQGMRKAFRSLDKSLLQKINALTVEHQVSFKAICLAAHVYLLHILCSETDVVTGVVTHERPALEDSGNIMGCFLNTVPVRVDFTKVKDTITLLKVINSLLVTSKPNEIHLGEIAALVERTTSAENPIFDTLFNFTDFHSYEHASKSSALTSVESPLSGSWTGETNEMTNTLFDLELDKTMDRFLLKIKYTPAYFHEDEIRYAQDLYVRILESFIADARAPLVPEKLLVEAERSQLLYGFNNTVSDYSKDKTLHQLFEEQVLRTPDNIALRQHGEILTYKQLNERANQVAAHLRVAGIKPGDNVGLLVTRSFDMITGMYGILKAGAAYVPIDPEYPADRQEYIITNSGVTKLLLNTPPEDGLRESLTNVEFISLNDDEILKHSTTNLPIAVSSTQQAYTIYTSGSTGRPKGVMIEHHSAVNLVEWVNETFNVDENDRLLFITSMCFDLSVYDIFGILAAGATVVIATKDEVQDVRKLQQLLLDEQITFWDSVPTTLNYLTGSLEMDDESYRQHHLRLVFLSGDWIPLQLPSRIWNFFPQAQVISLGGATEGTVWSNYYPVKEVKEHWSSIPYGVPIKNNFFYILNDNLQPVPKGVVGELFIGGVGVAVGYANDAEKTANAFKPDPFNNKAGGRMYRTGDLGRWMPDGNMEILGRKDNQVKVRGFRVELGEIESVLLKHESVKEAIVNVVKDASSNNQLCAYIVPLATVEKKVLRSYLKDMLPSYMVPEYFVMLDAIPLNSNGKIDRKKLPAPLLNDESESALYEAPVTTLEKGIEKIWKMLLNVERVSITADVFELGANSLAVGAFVSRLSRDMGLSVTIREVFLNPTIAGIASLLIERHAGVAKSIQPAPQQDAYVLSSAQQRLYFIDQIDDNSEAYNISGVFVLEGELQRGALDSAFDALVKRHETLRTVFREDEEGNARQHILPASLANKIDYHDLRGLSQSDALLRKLIRGSVHRRFNLAKGPLVHASLYQLSETKWVFSYLLHHIITDGWSMNIFMRELLMFYNSFKHQQPVALQPLRIQYKDYAVWQQSQMTDGLLKKHGDWWKSQFQGKLPVLTLPFDKPRPAVKTYNGDMLRMVLNKELTAKLKSYVREHEGTLFMALVTAVNALMSTYSGQDDIILGTSVAGREQPDLENQLGFYVNTIPLRTRFSNNASFASLFSKVKRTTLDAYEHQLYPFDELVQALNLKRDASRNQLFDVMVVLQNTRAGGAMVQDLGGLTVSRYKDNEHKASQFDLAFDFFDAGEELVAGIEYNTDLFQSETISLMADHLQQLMNAMVSDPSQKISSLNYKLPAQLLPPKQSKKAIVNDLNL
jgi:amino acid adenylation domain-containing protein